MFGLPDGLDVNFFLGAVLTQVCIGSNEVIVRFDRDIDVTIEGDVEIGDERGKKMYGRPPDYGRATVPFLQEAVTRVDVSSGGTLTLQLQSGSIAIIDSHAHYESYQIRHGHDLYVV